MAEQEYETLSPTVKKIFDEFFSVLNAADEIDKQSLNNLNQLLQTGKIPTFDEIENALFPPLIGDKL